MTPIYRTAALAILLLASVAVSAQSELDSLRINARYQNQSLTEILEDLGRRYDFQLYAPAGQLPETPRSFSFSEEPLPRALSRLLAGTELGFLFYRSYLLVIADRERLAQQYQPVYFQALEAGPAPDETGDQATTFEIGSPDALSPDGQARLEGVVRNQDDGQTIAGATIYFPELETGASTDADGRFALQLPIGRQTFTLSYLGYNTLTAAVHVFNDGRIEIDLEKVGIALEEVVVEAQAADANVSSAAIGLTQLRTEDIRKLPAFMGEVDVLKSLLQQPGVSTVGEGANGFNVRGGNVDQNLVLMDEQFVFNTSHALGFFSAFNPDMVSGVNLYKGYMPAQYGGRLSSVLDVEMRDGNARQFMMKGGVGLVSARISAEGPVIRDKSSFLAGFRTTYSDWILNQINIPEVRNSSARFYDANLRYTHRFDENNQLIASLNAARDETVFNDEFGFDYATRGGQLTYRKILDQRLTSALSATASQYDAMGKELRDSVTSAQLYTRYQYLKLKEVLTYNPNNDLSLLAGFSGIYYRILPGEKKPFGRLSTVVPIILETEQALESAVFSGVDWSASPRFSLSAGLRLVFYRALGPGSYFNYENPELPAEESITGQTDVSAGETIARYQSLEPRLGLRYSFNPQTSVKLGYSRTTQFINQLANLTTPTPVSIWQLSNRYIEPQRAHGVSLGLFKNLRNNAWETSLEGYYRHIDRLIDFRDFAELSANPHIETELHDGTGRAYGLELSIRKNKGDLNGWLSYTYSRTLQQIDEINNGEWYPAHFDKPHNLTLVANWQLTGRISLVLNYTYSTGRPITAPIGRYTAAGQFSVLEYSDRNQVRIPDYHRLDAAFTLDQSYRKTKRFKSNWTLSIYNLYGRRNPYSVFFQPNNNRLPRAIRLSVLGSAFVSLSFNFFFQ